MPRITISASGSLPIVGGFTVYDRPNASLNVALSAKCYATIEKVPLRESDPRYPYASPRESCIRAHVSAPQTNFDNFYEYTLGTSELSQVRPGGKVNHFIDVTLRTVLATFEQLLPADQIEVMTRQVISITLHGDNEFYSIAQQLTARKLPSIRSSASSLPKFLPTTSGFELDSLGLGSSAALVAAFVGALFVQYNLLHIQPTAARRPANLAKELSLVHTISQIAHAIAKKQHLSGHDVYTAIFSSCNYIRYTSGELELIAQRVVPLSGDALIGVVQPDSSISSMGYSSKMKWDHVSKPFSLPPGIALIACETADARSPRNNLTAILDWKFANAAKASAPWAALQLQTEAIFDHFSNLHKLSASSAKVYNTELAACAGTTWTEWIAAGGSVGPLLAKIHECFNETHRILRDLGKLTSLDIEPTPLAKLIDATSELRGVLASGVPAGGGRGVVFAIVLGEGVISSVDAFWSSWSGSPITIIPVRESKQGLEWANLPA